MILTFLGNILGFGAVLLGIVEIGEGWRQMVLFILGAAFLVVKLLTGAVKLGGLYIDLLKKKNSTLKAGRLSANA